jgi:hypothetical protein
MLPHEEASAATSRQTRTSFTARQSTGTVGPLDPTDYR